MPLVVPARRARAFLSTVTPRHTDEVSYFLQILFCHQPPSRRATATTTVSWCASGIQKAIQKAPSPSCQISKGAIRMHPVNAFIPLPTLAV